MNGENLTLAVLFGLALGIALVFALAAHSGPRLTYGQSAYYEPDCPHLLEPGWTTPRRLC